MIDFYFFLWSACYRQYYRIWIISRYFFLLCYDSLSIYCTNIRVNRRDCSIVRWPCHIISCHYWIAIEVFKINRPDWHLHWHASLRWVHSSMHIMHLQFNFNSKSSTFWIWTKKSPSETIASSWFLPWRLAVYGISYSVARQSRRSGKAHGKAQALEVREDCSTRYTSPCFCYSLCNGGVWSPRFHCYILTPSYLLHPVVSQNYIP